MTEIEDVVNIGPVLARELRAAGITSREALRQLGLPDADRKQIAAYAAQAKRSSG
jgi:TfoX C-terminal domain